MFCLMDVSGSMDEARKDLAKRFFILLYLFLTRHYEKIDIVFIRHHTQAAGSRRGRTSSTPRETGGTVVSSALVLMDEIIRARYTRERLEHLRRAGVATATTGTTTRPRAASCWTDKHPAASAATSPTCRWPTKSRTCGRSTRSCATRNRTSRCRRSTTPSQIYPGVPRPVQEGSDARAATSTRCAGRSPSTRRTPMPLRSAPAGAPAAAGPSDWTFELIEQYHEEIRATAAALRARHLSEPARGHHRRADDGRLRLGRHAGELPPLELRQGVHRHREELSARPDGPGLRDRHQLRSLHRLPDGGEHDWRCRRW